MNMKIDNNNKVVFIIKTANYINNNKIILISITLFFFPMSFELNKNYGTVFVIVCNPFFVQ